MSMVEDFGLWIDVGAGIATVILVAIVWIQTKQTQRQIDATLRPWIGARERIRFENSRTLMFPYTNYGQIPPQGITVDFMIAPHEINRDDIVVNQLSQHNAILHGRQDLGTVMPIMKKELRIHPTNEQIDAMRASQYQYYVGIVIQYRYAHKKDGEYGVIYHHDAETGFFRITKEWSH